MKINSTKSNGVSKWVLLFFISTGLQKSNYLISEITNINIQNLVGITLFIFPTIFILMAVYEHFNSIDVQKKNSSIFVNITLGYIFIMTIYGIVNGNSIGRIFEELWTGIIVYCAYKISLNNKVWELFQGKLFFVYLFFAITVLIGTQFSGGKFEDSEIDLSSLEGLSVATEAYEISPILDFWPFLLVLNFFNTKKNNYLTYLPFIIYLGFQLFFLKRAPTIRAVFTFILLLYYSIYYVKALNKKNNILIITLIGIIVSIFYFPSDLSDRFKSEDNARQLELINMFSQLNGFEIIFGRGLGGTHEIIADGISDGVSETGKLTSSFLHIGAGLPVLKGGVILFILIFAHYFILIVKNFNRLRFINSKQITALIFLFSFSVFRFIEGTISPGSLVNSFLLGLSIGVLEVSDKNVNSKLEPNRYAI
jgi:hypothetical protein